MKSTIVVLSHNRPIQDVTRDVIGQMTRLGAGYVSQQGSSDVTLARCLALTGACNALRKLNTAIREQHAKYLASSSRSSVAMQIEPGPPAPRPEYDTILMVDDDMSFTVDDAQALVNHTRQFSTPASAMYCTEDKRLAASLLRHDVGDRPRWLTGLGLLAIPAWQLLKLEQESEEFQMIDAPYRAFTSSGARGGAWRGEDFTLCERLGGVHLLPIAIGHLKTVAIIPDDESINIVRAGGVWPPIPAAT